MLIAALMAILVMITVANPADRLAPTISTKSTCSESLQARVDAASPNSVVQTPGDCVYRETVTIDKPLTLKADSGAEIRGSDVWTNWQKNGVYWVKGTVPSFPPDPDMATNGRCKSGTSRCLWPEQVFFDGKPLLQVASNPQSGQFAVDGSRRVMRTVTPTGTPSRSRYASTGS